MSFIADTRNNPFHVDDGSTPPQRSAFAVLEVERDELREIGLDRAYQRARRRIDGENGLSVVYGRSLEEDDLRIALVRLESPRDRVVSELLDYRFEPFQLGEIEELADVLEAFKAALSCPDAPRVEDPSLIARILAEKVARPELPAPESPRTAPPELPSLEESLRD